MFEWHDEKRPANLDRHRPDFVDARLLFDGRPVISYPSMRGDEVRFVTVGRIGSKFYAVVWAERSDAF